MTLADTLNAVGKTLIGLGIVILLFAGYQLWGTNLQEARAQNSLENEFQQLLSQASQVGLATVPPPSSAPDQATTTATPAPTTTLVDTVLGAEDLTPEQLAYFFPEGGEAVGALDIGDIGVSKIVVEGVTVADLREGPGHYSSSPFPGQPGNAAIAGHRTTYGAPFNRIDELQPGDDIVVTTVQGTFVYEVMPAGEAYPDAGLDFERSMSGHLVVSPSETWVLDDFGDNRLTLTACHPKFSARQRIIVAARLVAEPAVAVPRPAQLAEGETVVFADPDTGQEVEITGSAELADQAANEVSLDEGLGWDRKALPDVVTLAMVFLAILAAAIAVANRWRRLTTYAVAIVPLGVSLWFCFEQLDRLLPAY